MYHIVLIMWVWCYSTVYYCAGGAVVSVGSNSGIYSSVVDSITCPGYVHVLYGCTLNTTDSYPCIYPDYYLVVECCRRELLFMCCNHTLFNAMGSTVDFHLIGIWVIGIYRSTPCAKPLLGKYPQTSNFRDVQQ